MAAAAAAAAAVARAVQTTQPQHSRHHLCDDDVVGCAVSTFFTKSVTLFAVGSECLRSGPSGPLTQLCSTVLVSARQVHTALSVCAAHDTSSPLGDATLSRDSGMCIGRESLTGLSKSLASVETRQSGLLSVVCCRETVVTI